MRHILDPHTITTTSESSLVVMMDGAGAPPPVQAAAVASPTSASTILDGLLMDGVAFNPADPNELFELVDLLGEVCPCRRVGWTRVRIKRSQQDPGISVERVDQNSHVNEPSSQGSYGAVYRAQYRHDPSLPPVAIKIIPADVSERDWMLRSMNEFAYRIDSRVLLNHPINLFH